MHAITSGTGALTKHDRINVHMGEGEVKDLKFADDREVMVLLRKKGSWLTFRFQSLY